MEKQQAIISMRNVVKIYKTRNVRFKALCGISLDIYPNEFVAITGTSGSGKSTILNLLAGLERPSAGKVFVNAQPIYKMSEKELVDFRLRNVGFIFQKFNLLNTLTVLENVAFPLMLRGIPEKKRLQTAEKLLVMIGLQQHLEHYPDELSGGQQQRVAIARAIIARPRIVFADEPTGNLDSRTANQISSMLMEEVHQGGATLLLVTHDIEKARYADRIIRLVDGEIAGIEKGESV